MTPITNDEELKAAQERLNLLTQITEDEGLIGKTILRAQEHDDDYYLFFTDNTYCVFDSIGYGEYGVELSGKDKLVLDIHSISRLRSLGLITLVEWEHFRKTIDQQDSEARKQKELDTLKALKAKYPDA